MEKPSTLPPGKYEVTGDREAVEEGFPVRVVF